MKVVILQSNYIPWKGYFDLINDADIFVFYDCVKYTKNDWRNRNKIYTKNGLQWLTIPISSNATKQLIEEVDIDNGNWQNLHYNSLFYGYRKAPFFYQLEELLEIYLVNNRWVKLSNLNQFLIKLISEKIGIKTVFRQANDFEMKGNKIEKLLSILNSIGASEYISGKAAQSYLFGSETMFNDYNIQLTYKEYPNYPVYRQLSSNFEQSVSILDMIANIDWSEINSYIWNYER